MSKKWLVDNMHVIVPVMVHAVIPLFLYFFVI